MNPTSEWQSSACILCFNNCGIRVKTRDGHIVKVRGDEANPLSNGYVCNKASRLDYYQNSKDRLTEPLRRKEDGSFEKIDWDTAIGDIADRLVKIRDQHGGGSFIQIGGGQANHLSQAYFGSISTAMGSHWRTNSLAQEKTGEYWVDGRLFGHQGVHTTHDIERTQVAVFVGKNPWQSHGFPEARKHLNALSKDPNRKLIVIDPVVTDTAKRADIHLRVRPGADAFLLAAICSIIVSEQGLLDQEFLAKRTTGADAVIKALSGVPIEEFCAKAGVPVEQAAEVARVIGEAESACIFEDLGIEQSRNSALNSYLEKLLYLLTGNMGNRGGVNLNLGASPNPGGHTSEEPGAIVTPVTGQKVIADLVPCKALPDEILTEHPDRFRAMWINSANPVVTYPDSQRMAEAMEGLELLVVVDVALTETARHAHYVLPAASQFEKWDASMLYLRSTYPENTFHLRAPVLPLTGNTLPEPEIARRLVRAMGALTDSLDDLHVAAAKGRTEFAAAFTRASQEKPEVGKFAPVVLYETLGSCLPDGADSAALLWPLAHQIAAQEAAAVRRAGHIGDGPLLGESLFDAILEGRSGIRLTVHEYEDNWGRVEFEDNKVHLEIREMIAALHELQKDTLPTSLDYPFIMAAGERRASNANAIMRDPAWRTGDKLGHLRMHPDDAHALGLIDGDMARITSNRASVEAPVEISTMMPVGFVSLPHGFGMLYSNADGLEEAQGAMVNQLTDLENCCPIAGTPYHKYVPVQIEATVRQAAVE
jgi:formate dehydrogenase